MHPIELMGMTAGGGVGICALVVSFRHLHQRRSREAAVVHLEPPSLVRILRDEGELKEALRRAASFERLAAEGCRVRIDRYESMLEPRCEPALAPPPSLQRAPETAA
jgi:hypothetical protein